MRYCIQNARSSFRRSCRSSRGVTLLDTLFGTALMLVVFLGVAAAFRLSVDVVSNNKARGGALALANERMEYLRSLPYAAVGTVGGIPSGSVPQSETVSMNGVTYVRRTFVAYGDDPRDGTGAADANGIPSDYKTIKTEVSWESRNGTRRVALVSRVGTASGMETTCTPPCGTLTINARNALSQPLGGASVSIVNPSAVPAVSISTFTNASGTASFIGAPAATGYQIVVSKPGYSTAQTYGPTAQNTAPNPAHITVSNGQTTTGTFAIDVLGSKTVSTWRPVHAQTWSDSFSNSAKIATSSNVSVTGGVATLANASFGGEAQSVAVAPSYLSKWNALSWAAATPGGSSVRVRLYDDSGALVPDAQLPGNAAGFTSSPVSLAALSTTTYQALRADAVFVPGTSAPSLDSWTIEYDYGPEPLPNVAFTLQGAKTIGSGPSGALYKYSQSLSSGSAASVTISALEWDTYTISLSGSGYDLASSCPSPQPETLAPGMSAATSLFLADHTAYSLLVDVRSNATGALIPGASVTITRSGFSANGATDSCGQAFFGNLAASASYSVAVSASGYAPKTQNNVSVSGASRVSIGL